MKYRDIVNRNLVNLTNCSQEPIHIPGSIQPHGCLLAVSAADLTIEYCSDNTFGYIGVDHKALLGKTLNETLGEEPTASFNNYIAAKNDSSAPWEIDLAEKRWLGNIHQSGQLHIIELEPRLEEPPELTDIYQQTKRMTAYLQQARTLKMLCQSVAEETRLITGYDRVMIYRFDEQYNGEVIAESVIETQEKFLGLHYPHTDIPAQARQLYIKNLLRIIVDVNYAPTPILTLDNEPGKTLDLSLSVLRSVSPIHIQYLQNIGVAATLTISLLHEGKLWGLIACHHYTPKYLTRYTRITAMLQGHFLTSQISVRKSGEDYVVAQKVNQAMDRLLDHLFNSEQIALATIVNNPDILLLTNAASVIILVDDKIYSQGNVPPQDEIKKLANWLHTYNTSILFSIENLSALYPEAKKWCASASGILFHALGSGQNNCIIWCRPHALQEVHWAGNPDKAIIIDEHGLSPRKSFDLWKEVKQCESNKWLQPELAAAANFSNALQKQVHLLFLTREELKQRNLSEKLQEANTELENLNWISTHDLKEPLRKIQMFASRIIEEDFIGNSARVLDLVKKMSASAERMQMLISDILTYSRASHVEEEMTMVSLDSVIAKVIDDLTDEIREKQAIVQYNDLPAVKAVPFLLHQLMVNLISNSLKFSRNKTAPHITITPTVRKGYHIISISDNGIGFENQFRESIFKVFTKLHSHSQYSGSGVGLALCRKIMKTHNGSITASGVPGEGAVFILKFPIH